MKRLAIYYAPPEDSPLSREAALWLGRNAFTNAVIEPEAKGFSRSEWEQIVQDPRVYGFHATLKAPFRLGEGADESDLFRRLRSFARTQRPFECRLMLGSLSYFLALVLAENSPGFQALAADCVRLFDEFRAAPTEEEIARRKLGRTSPAQLAHIERWGYPYVMEEWRFHMTLTSSLPMDAFEAARAHLKRIFEPLCRQPLLVDSICAFEQPEPGAPFRVVERFPFA